MRAISKNIIQSIIIPVIGVIISYILKNGIIELNVFFILVILSIIIGIVIFIVGYYSSKQKHYETDIEPIFNKLANININDLDSFQESWNNIKDSFIFKIEFDKLDSRNMARDHFKAYQKLNMIYAEIIDECEIYNSKVIKDIEDIEDIILSIFNQIPNLDKYSKKLKPNNNYYYDYTLSNYYWDKFMKNDDFELSIDQKLSNNYKLIYHTWTIAVGDREDLETLKSFFEHEKDNIISILKELKDEREKLIIKINEFKDLLNDVISNIQWNQPIKGKCGWERGYLKKI